MFSVRILVPFCSIYELVMPCSSLDGYRPSSYFNKVLVFGLTESSFLHPNPNLTKLSTGYKVTMPAGYVKKEGKPSILHSPVWFSV